MEAHANYPNCAPQCPWKGTYSGSTLVSQEAHFYGIGGRELAVYSLNGSGGATQTATKVYFKGKMVGVNGNAFVADRLGSLRYSNGQAVSFYPYGEDKGTPAANDQVKFATYTRDSVDLYDYADQRYYYSGWGRFLSPDPYSGSMDPANPQSWNRYSYLLGDPVNSIDPTGLAEVCEMDTPICTGGDPYPTTVDISPFAFDPTSGFSMFSDNPPPAFNSPIQLVASQVFDETGALTYTTTWIQVTGAAGLMGTGGATVGIIWGSSESLTLAVAMGATAGPEAVAFGVTADEAFTHFTSAEGLQGITGLDPTALSPGQTVAVNQLQFGFGQNPYLASVPGDIFVTNLPPTASSFQLSQIGVYELNQSFAISFSGDLAASQGAGSIGAGFPGIYTIPGGTVLNGCFEVLCRE